MRRVDASLHALEPAAVIPRDSEWFSFFNGTDLIPLKEQDTYKEDWIGLRSLDEKGGLFFVESPTMHMQFSLEWLHENILVPYLLPDQTQTAV